MPFHLNKFDSFNVKKKIVRLQAIASEWDEINWRTEKQKGINEEFVGVDVCFKNYWKLQKGLRRTFPDIATVADLNVLKTEIFSIFFKKKIGSMLRVLFKLP